MIWNLIGGQSYVEQAADRSPIFRIEKSYFEPQKFLTTLKKKAPQKDVDVEYYIAKVIETMPIVPGLKRTFALFLRHFVHVVKRAASEIRGNLGCVLANLIPIDSTPTALQEHALASLNQFPFWKDYTDEVCEMFIKQVPAGVQLVATQGKILESQYKELFPELEFMHLQPDEYDRDEGALGRNRCCLLLHESSKGFS